MPLDYSKLLRTCMSSLEYVVKAEDECKSGEFADLVLSNAAERCRETLRDIRAALAREVAG